MCYMVNYNMLHLTNRNMRYPVNGDTEVPSKGPGAEGGDAGNGGAAPPAAITQPNMPFDHVTLYTVL